MAAQEMDFDPVSHITTDAIGEPGKRVFYLQASHAERVVTLLVEKFQIQTLAIGVEQFLAELSKKFSNLSPASDQYVEKQMHILPPVEPMFRVGELKMGYQPERDRVILSAYELIGEESDPDDARVIRFWVTRSQLRSMSRWGLEVASRGRPICPHCGQPMDPEGHFCPKKNGHKH